ncbi:hypothetical protein [uncultured Bacteroides sp.]|uniref:hypothetical protein n=1 Tax=uncultured Bacteroides sp. TaxID=162156 RepID=UPI002621CE46|nr:hypothetical protein [uncultured Bacteroides sp.]
MKKIKWYAIIFIFLSLSLMSCKDNEMSINDSQPPVIEFNDENLEALPGESIKLTATVKDDVGIDYILIESVDWELSEKILFSKQNYIKEYDLIQSIIVPDQAQRGSVCEVVIKAFDHSGKSTENIQNISVTPESVRLEIVQDMGFNIVLAGRKGVVNGNDVSFEPVPNVILPISLTLTSNRTQLRMLTVRCESLNINDEIDLTSISIDNGCKAIINKEYSIQVGEAEKNEVIFTLIDNEGNTVIYNPMVSIKPTFEEHNEKHLALFTLDKDIDFSKVIFGLPMLAERKTNESFKFTAQYFSSHPNTEIIFVSSRDQNDRIEYGISSDKEFIIKSDNPIPLILPNIGYYEINIDLQLGTYEVIELGKQDSKFAEMYFVYHNWTQYPPMNQMNMDYPSIWTLDYDLTSAGGTTAAFGIGNGTWLVAGGLTDNEPEIWLVKEDKVLYPQYDNNFFDTEIPMNQYGECQIVFDNFLMKAYAIQK